MNSLPILDRIAKATELSKSKKGKSDRTESKVTPQITDWRKDRPNIDLDFVDVLYSPPSNVLLPLDSQESAILEDLLCCFVGRNGQFIVANPLTEPYSQRSFTIGEGINTRLVAMCQKCLKLAGHYSLLVRFIQDNRLLSAGRVNQALAAAMDAIVDDYMQTVLELEEGVYRKTINISSLWRQVQAPLETLGFLSEVILKIVDKNARGGRTLSILHKLAINSSRGLPSHDLAIFLITKASVPYLESVRKWIYRGVIFDPFDEFMIVENPRIQLVHDDFSDDYWLKKYQLRKDCLPNFLDQMADQILNSGKYLNAASHCLAGNALDFAPEEVLSYSHESEGYCTSILKAYNFSSRYLLDIILKNFHVVDRMKSVKRYFLLQQGDFISTVFDICREELSKLMCDIIPSRFSALIDVALRIPSTNDDIYRDVITLSLKQIGLVEQVVKILSINTDEELECKNDVHQMLTGIEAFALSVKYEWPVSLIFSKKVISCYQMLFRHLVYVKYVEMKLTNVWLRDMSLKRRKVISVQGWRNCSSIRHKMLTFVQSMFYYMTNEAIEPNWLELMSEMASLESVDDLLKKHWNFLDNCMKDCLLTNPGLLRTFRDILIICKDFCDFTEMFDNKRIDCTTRNYNENIKNFDTRFNETLIKFLQTLEISVDDANKTMLNLLHTLDINLVNVRHS